MPTFASPLALAILLSLWSAASFAEADLPAKKALQAPPVLWAPSTWGVRSTAGIGTATAGDWLMFELGAEMRGGKTLTHNAWLFRWEGWLVARGGKLANEHPFLSLYGGRERLALAVGRRFEAAQSWSPYLGLAGAQEFRWLGHPGLAPSALDTVNNVDGVAGPGLEGTLRAESGLSFLGEHHALLLTAFLGEHVQRHEINLPTFAFTVIGLAARFDSRGGFTAEADAWWGATPWRRDAARDLLDRTNRTVVSALLRQTLGAHMWLSLASSWARDRDRLSYDGSGLVLPTADAPTFTLTAAWGWTLGAGL